jgi:hypothetical protein
MTGAHDDETGDDFLDRHAAGVDDRLRPGGMITQNVASAMTHLGRP